MSEKSETNNVFWMVDGLPNDVIATMETRDRFVNSAQPKGEDQAKFVVDQLRQWLPGKRLRVAFFGGDSALHRDIEQATKQITDACNIKLDFGFNAATGKYRTWSQRNRIYQAEIRVSFDQTGFFSLVGRDSITPAIGTANRPVGGRPYQRSLNLGGFVTKRPDDWVGIVRHEFLHALAFHHEHQSPEGPCAQEFRWDDDDGYVATTDGRGVFIADAQGRRPGIYTYLGGAPNHWPRAQVDFNLRQLPPQGLQVGTFDRQSIMLYRFPSLFYKSDPSLCAPLGNGVDLSDGDRAGLQTLYPTNPLLAGFIASGQRDAMHQLLQATNLPADLRRSIEIQLEELNQFFNQPHP